MKAKNFVIILLFLVSIMTSCTDKVKKEFDAKVQKAELLQKKGKLEEAKALYLEAQKLYPKNKSIAGKIASVETKLTEKKDNDFKKLVLKADDLYEEGMYGEARDAYLEAFNLKSDAVEIQDKINEIDAIFSKASDEEEVIDDDTTKPYHIIVGSFQNEAYALKLQEELINKSYNSRIINRPNGYYAVSLTSHPDIHEAYNHINAAVEYNLNAWVVRD